MSVTRLQVKEMYRFQKECGFTALDKKLVTREELERHFPFVKMMKDFDELYFRYGPIRYRIRVLRGE